MTSYYIMLFDKSSLNKKLNSTQNMYIYRYFRNFLSKSPFVHLFTDIESESSNIVL